MNYNYSNIVALNKIFIKNVQTIAQACAVIADAVSPQLG